MRGITRLFWAVTLVIVLALAAGCGGMGQTVSESTFSEEDSAASTEEAPAQEMGGFGEVEVPSIEFPEVQPEEASPALFP